MTPKSIVLRYYAHAEINMTNTSYRQIECQMLELDGNVVFCIEQKVSSINMAESS